MTSNEWTVECHVEDNGAVPVREFLKALEQQAYARFLWSLEQLRQRNILTREPLVRHVAGKSWELNVACSHLTRFLECEGSK